MGYGFVSLLGLRVSVLYSEAGLRLSWGRGVARAVVGGKLRLRTAAEYEVRLRTPGAGDGKYYKVMTNVIGILKLLFLHRFAS